MSQQSPGAPSPTQEQLALDGEDPGAPEPEAAADEASSAPARPRTLADIWAPHHQGPEEAVLVDRPTGERLVRGDVAQRALAEIWRNQTDTPSPGLGLTSTAAPAPTSALSRGATGAAHGRTPAPSHSPTATRAPAPRGPHALPVAPGVPKSIEACLELAGAQLQDGHIAEAITPLESAVTALETDASAALDDQRRLASTRATLARAYLDTRRPLPAIRLYETLLAGNAPITTNERLAYRIKLAQAHRAAGDASTATAQLESLVAELESCVPTGTAARLFDARVELATTYVVANRLGDGIAAYERTLADAGFRLGPEDRKSLTVRLLLARAHQQTGRTEPATAAYRELIAQAENALGPDDKLTRQAQAELDSLLRNHGR